MKSIRKAALACIVATMAIPLAAGAQTEPRNQDTYFTFSQPVELPNTTLPAGTYLFQLADSPSNRHIVRVMSQDRQKLHTTLMAIPSYSLDRPAEDPQVRFMEGPETGPQAIKVWFYPGRSVGHEFIYPRSQAMRLAQRTGDSVLTTKTDTAVTNDVTDQDITRVDRSGADTAANMNGQTAPPNARSQSGTMQSTPSTAETAAMTSPESNTQSATATADRAAAQASTPPAAQRTEQARAQTPAPDRTADSTMDRAPAARTADQTRDELPRTASLLPLLALVGLGSIAGSRWLRRSRRMQA
jgi:hypothetical protein